MVAWDMSEPNADETDTLSCCDTAVVFSLDIKGRACGLLGMQVKVSYLLDPGIHCALQGVHSSLLHQKDLQVKDLQRIGFCGPLQQAASYADSLMCNSSCVMPCRGALPVEYAHS